MPYSVEQISLIHCPSTAQRNLTAQSVRAICAIGGGANEWSSSRPARSTAAQIHRWRRRQLRQFTTCFVELKVNRNDSCLRHLAVKLRHRSQLSGVHRRRQLLRAQGTLRFTVTRFTCNVNTRRVIEWHQWMYALSIRLSRYQIKIYNTCT